MSFTEDSLFCHVPPASSGPSSDMILHYTVDLLVNYS